MGHPEVAAAVLDHHEVVVGDPVALEGAGQVRLLGRRVHRIGAFSDPGSFDNPLVGNHGGPQTRDNFFAVIGGGPGVRSQTLSGNQDPLFDDTLSKPGQAENVDVAPTVMRLFGMAAPSDSDGRFLSEAFDLGCVPGGGAPAGRAVKGPRCRAPRS